MPKRDLSALGLIGIDRRDADLERRDDVGKTLATGDMEMGAACLGAEFRLQPAKQSAYLGRIGVATRIGKPTFVYAALGHRLAHAHRLVVAHDTRDRAAKSNLNTRFNLYVRKLLIAERDDAADFLDHLLGGLADVGERVFVSHRNGERDLMHACFECALTSSEVWSEHGDVQIRDREGVRDDFAVADQRFNIE